MSQQAEPQRVPEPRRPKRRRSAASRVIGWLFLLLLVGAVTIGAAGFYAYRQYSLAGPLAENKIVMIGKGLGTPEIAALLQDQGIIRDAGIFSVMAYVKGTRTSLKPGEYEFGKEDSMRDVMTRIANGKSITYKLSVPEGWTTEMALERIRSNEVLTGDISKEPPEGAILPDTYLFKRGDTRQGLVDGMVAAQEKLLDDLWTERTPALNLKTKQEAVTLASIVEKETAKAEERPVIASVFLNRLEQSMRLQSDPTIIYGIAGGKGKLGRALTRSDIRTPTPYNTYIIKGLPPGPIANPGRAALEAASNPARTREIFFVADGSGGHTFSETLDQHQRAVTRLRQVEQQQRDSARDAVASPPPPDPSAATGSAPKTQAPRAAPAAPARGGSRAAPPAAAPPTAGITSPRSSFAPQNGVR